MKIPLLLISIFLLGSTKEFLIGSGVNLTFKSKADFAVWHRENGRASMVMGWMMLAVLVVFLAIEIFAVKP